MRMAFIPAPTLEKSVTRNQSRGKQRANAVTQFVAVDGEGMGRNAEHKYVLFGIGNTYISRNTDIQWWEAFTALYDHYRDNMGSAYVGFFLSYDFTRILRSLPQSRAEMLFLPERIATRRRRHNHARPFPVACTDPTGIEWEFDILGSKRLAIRPRACDCPRRAGFPLCKCKAASWLYVCDAGPFFQAAFLTVIEPSAWQEPIVSDEEYERIALGKSLRDVAVFDQDMIDYNQLENEALTRVMGELDKGLRQIGVRLKVSQWFGPGQAAQEWLKTLKLPKTEALREIIPEWFMKAAQQSYYGGWFEIFMHGHIPGETHEYDINSAYPAIIATLPCLQHGKWARGRYDTKLPKDGYTLVHCRIRGNDRYIGPVPFRRKDGSICRPLVAEGIYWLAEIRAAQAAGLVSELDILEWWHYLPCDCPAPLASIKSLYSKRLEVGKDTPLGKSCKLIYNSAYGKFAQSVGGEFVQYGNAIYASLITSGCRRMILNAIGTHPERSQAVTMVATDGVYFSSPHPTLHVAGNLGEWSHSVKKNLTQFKPGVYWDDKSREAISAGKSAKFKSRGISAKDFGKRISDIDAGFRDARSILSGNWPEIEFTIGFSMVTCKQALRRNNWASAGEVSEKNVKHTSDATDKRGSLYLASGTIRSKPLLHAYPDNDTDISTPYSETFGWAYESDENGVTPDGTVDETTRWVVLE